MKAIGYEGQHLLVDDARNEVFSSGRPAKGVQRIVSPGRGSRPRRTSFCLR